MQFIKTKDITNVTHLKKHFFSAGDLMKHINAFHKGDSCKKIFSRTGRLKQHINAVHNGQKDHKCNTCEKSF